MHPPSASLDSPATGGLLRLRPAEQRFHSRNEWLDSWHTFSFADHFDPRWSGFGALRVINDDRIAAGRGFGMHPHRDMEIITVMVEGELSHQDSMGNSALLRAGEVQRMSAGTGIVHSEINRGERDCRLLQIWIEPETCGIVPAYEQKPFTIGTGWTPLIDPDRANGALAIHRPVRLWRARPQGRLPLGVSLAAGSSGWIQVIGGLLEARGAEEGSPVPLGAGDGLGFKAGAITTLETGEGGADLLLFELR